GWHRATWSARSRGLGRVGDWPAQGADPHPRRSSTGDVLVSRLSRCAHLLRAPAVLVLAVSTLVATLAAEAQQGGRVFRIGYLGTAPLTAETRPLWEAFLGGLRERGYVEGQNIAIERRDAEGIPERLAGPAAELVQLHVDAIIAPTTADALAARQVTSTIPVITVTAGDPVASGLVRSLARPGGNVPCLCPPSPRP